MKSCFFCNPDRDRILYESEHFYALLGLGAIVEGYTLLVSKQHIRSMFDLPDEMRNAYIEEKRHLKQLLHKIYGPAIITEHGRVQSCTIDDEEPHEHHCFHAHQHFFPVEVDLGSLSLEGPFIEMFRGDSMFDMHGSSLEDEDEYLLYENTADVVATYKVIGKCPRQYMRYLVARSVGKPELVSWRLHPEWDKIKLAKAKYADVFRSVASLN
jgi:diadenosine tetraphosphate (Ap4A) HIT family hydrolase